MESLEEKVAIITGARSGNGVAVARPNRKKMIGLALCLGAVVVVVAGWTWARESGAASTDNAYVRGDVTSLAPKVAGYVTAIEVEDNQAVRAGDVLFRIDDRDYRAKLAQAVANVEAAEARLTNVDAEMALQHALIRQAEAQRRSVVAELNLAAKASDRRRELIRSNTISQAHVDESDAAKSRAEANVLAASATVEAQQQRIAVLAAQREAAVAAVAQAEAARDLAGIDLESTVVRAPVGGVIGNRQVRVGRLVAPGASCSISFRSTMYGSSRISRKPSSNISGPVSAPASPSMVTRGERLKAWWTVFHPAAALPSACCPQTTPRATSSASSSAFR